jgi:hypothetical protein
MLKNLQVISQKKTLFFLSAMIVFSLILYSQPGYAMENIWDEGCFFKPNNPSTKEEMGKAYDFSWDEPTSQYELIEKNQKDNISKKEMLQKKFSEEPVGDESELKKFQEQKRHIDSYLENPLEKLNEYAESVFQELEQNENFRKGKEHFEKFQRTRIKDRGKYNDYIQDYLIKKNNFNENIDSEVLYFCGTYIYDLLKEKATINKNVYCHFTMGICLSYLLSIQYPDTRMMHYGKDRKEIWYLDDAFLNLVQDTLTLEKNELNMKVNEFLSNVKDKYSLFEYIPPIFLYGETAIFTPQTVNYARHLEKTCDIFGLYAGIKIIHTHENNSLMGMRHDYAHYHDTIVQTIDTYLFRTQENRNRVVRQHQKNQSHLYQMIEDKESPFSTQSQKQVAHYIIMYALRDLYFKSENIILILLNSKTSFSEYLITLQKHLEFQRPILLKSGKDVASDYYDNACSLVKFFPLLEPKIFDHHSKKEEYNFNFSATLLCHEILLEWFVKKVENRAIKFSSQPEYAMENESYFSEPNNLITKEEMWYADGLSWDEPTPQHEFTEKKSKKNTSKKEMLQKKFSEEPVYDEAELKKFQEQKQHVDS